MLRLKNIKFTPILLSYHAFLNISLVSLELIVSLLLFEKVTKVTKVTW